MIETIQKVTDVIGAVVPLFFYLGIILFITLVPFIYWKKKKCTYGLMEQTTASLKDTDNSFKKNLVLRKQQIENQEKIISLLEDIKDKIKS